MGLRLREEACGVQVCVDGSVEVAVEKPGLVDATVEQLNETIAWVARGLRIEFAPLRVLEVEPATWGRKS